MAWLGPRHELYEVENRVVNTKNSTSRPPAWVFCLQLCPCHVFFVRKCFITRRWVQKRTPTGSQFEIFLFYISLGNFFFDFRNLLVLSHFLIQKKHKCDGWVGGSVGRWVGRSVGLYFFGFAHFSKTT